VKIQKIQLKTLLSSNAGENSSSANFSNNKDELEGKEIERNFLE